MLEPVHRMRSSEDFRVTVRRGARAAQPTLVTHMVSGESGTTSVGLVVSKSVGTAVVRNRVKRRLRHLMRRRLVDVPGGSLIVIRALPAARDASSATLAGDLDAALTRAGAR
ncbi:MAG: ribonuclease P protein component [Aeromicrobium sp.]